MTMNTETEINCSQLGSIYTIEFNRPKKKHALTNAMYRRLAAEFHRIPSDSSVRVILLCGQGDCFSSGNDLRDFLQTSKFDRDHPAFQFLLEISTCPLPIVAAVQGVAIGVGATMLLHCDLVYVGSNCRFQFPFVDLGLVPEGASTLLLPRCAGNVLANELLMLGEPFDGQAALRAGLANGVVADAEVRAKARSSAEKLAKKDPEAIRQTKRLLKSSLRDPIRQTLELEAKVFSERLQGEAAQKALSQFFQVKAGE